MRLLFQPAEEGGAGASHIIKEGALDGVEAIFAMHVDYRIPTGVIAAHPGPTQAAVCFFQAKIEGKTGMADTPHLNVDPIVKLFAYKSLPPDSGAIRCRPPPAGRPVYILVNFGNENIFL